jgi:hypothetical protein
MTNQVPSVLKKCEGQRGGIFSKLLFLIFVVVFVAILYLARHPILRFAGDFWIARRERRSFLDRAWLRAFSPADGCCGRMPG